MNTADARIKHERAKEQGRICRRNGGKREQCPYKAGTMTSQRDSWFMGFDEASQDMRRRR